MSHPDDRSGSIPTAPERRPKDDGLGKAINLALAQARRAGRKRTLEALGPWLEHQEGVCKMRIGSSECTCGLSAKLAELGEEAKRG